MISNARPVTDSAIRAASAIAAAAANTGTDFNFLMAQARLESGLDPAAHAKSSSAAGLFQFTKASWLDVLDRHGAEHGLAWAADAIARENGRAVVTDPAARAAIEELRFDPEASAAMGAAYASDNRAHLGSILTRAPEDVELYLAHFLGPDGATRFIRAHQADPSTSAAGLFPAAAAANTSVFYDHVGRGRSVSEVRDLFAARLNAARPIGGTSPIENVSTRSTANWVATRQSIRVATSASRPMQLAAFVEIPDRPSLDFAVAAFDRLSGVGR